MGSGYGVFRVFIGRRVWELKEFGLGNKWDGRRRIRGLGFLREFDLMGDPTVDCMLLLESRHG